MLKIKIRRHVFFHLFSPILLSFLVSIPEKTFALLYRIVSVYPFFTVNQHLRRTWRDNGVRATIVNVSRLPCTCSEMILRAIPRRKCLWHRITKAPSPFLPIFHTTVVRTQSFVISWRISRSLHCQMSMRRNDTNDMEHRWIGHRSELFCIYLITLS